MAGFADSGHKVGFHILLPRIGNCHLRSIDIKSKRGGLFHFIFRRHGWFSYATH
nr:MAG TPA: hypothetical protein [Caudoviricetes sp.]